MSCVLRVAKNRTEFGVRDHGGVGGKMFSSICPDGIFDVSWILPANRAWDITATNKHPATADAESKTRMSFRIGSSALRAAPGRLASRTFRGTGTGVGPLREMPRVIPRSGLVVSFHDAMRVTSQIIISCQRRLAWHHGHGTHRRHTLPLTRCETVSSPQIAQVRFCSWTSPIVLLGRVETRLTKPYPPGTSRKHSGGLVKGHGANLCYETHGLKADATPSPRILAHASGLRPAAGGGMGSATR